MSENANDSDFPAAELIRRNIDGFLLMWVIMVNRGYFEPQITLNVGGLVVTGKLISAKKYYEAIGTKLSDAWERASEEGADAIKYFSSLAEAVVPPDEKALHIHLANARFIFPEGRGIPSDGQGAYWRGKLSSIDGFQFTI